MEEKIRRGPKKRVVAEITDDSKRLMVVKDEFGGTDQAFADLLEISRSSLYRMLTSKQPLTFEIARIVCYRLGYSADWFVGGLGKKKTKGEKPAKLITDVSMLKTDIQIVNARIDVINARMKSYETK